MARILVLSLLLVLSIPVVAHADDRDCMAKYYQTQDKQCVDSIVLKAPPVGPAGVPTVNPGMLGFIAQIFQSDPHEKERLLALEVPQTVKPFFMLALFLADLPDEARLYAKANGLNDGFDRLSTSGPHKLNDIAPSYNGGDNDTLIGAYMASGNSDFIKKVLTNFSSADDEMVGIALRLSMMQGKFGPTIAPPNREKSVALKTACDKYECKKDPRKLMRILTLSSAFWAIQSLSREDDGIKATSNDFFNNDPRLQRLLLIESNAFGNYITTLALYSVLKDNPNVNESLSIYEHLGSAQEASSALMKKKN